MIIRKTDAYIVNLMDTTGDHLMSQEEVQTIIDNKLGEIIDKWAISLWPREKMQLHRKILESIGEIECIVALINGFESAKGEEPR